MNSERWYDPLQELWQQQPAPAPVRADDRLLRAVQTAEEQWQLDGGDYAKINYWLLPVLTLPQLVSAYSRGDEFLWGEWLCLVFWWIMLLSIVGTEWRRRKLERDFGSTLLGRIERGRGLLRLRQGVNHLNLVAVLVFPAMMALLLQKWAGMSDRVTLMVGFGLLPVAAGLLVPYWRRWRVRCQERIAALEAMRTELAGSGPDQA